MASEPITGRTEQEQIERGWPFIVRRNPQPIPQAAIDAQPAACALINLEWLAHIVGAIEAINQPDAWQGTDEQIYQAQQQLEQLANAFKDICEMSQGAQVQFRQTECTLEMSDDGGATWSMIFNAGCAKTVITYNAETGYIEADGEPIVSGDTIINNTIIVDDTDGIAPTGLNKRCDVASYWADLMLPSLVAEIVTVKRNSANNASILTALLAFAVGITGAIFAPVTGGTSLALTFGAIGLGVLGGELAAAVANVDPDQVELEVTPQFWQDVKCKIYCALPSTGIIDESNLQDIADEIATLTNYPWTIPALVESIRLFSGEALGKFNIFGALYDGSNCDLCSCAPWYTIAFKGQISVIGNQPTTPWYSKYLEFIGTTAYDPAKGAILDTAATSSYDKVEFILDVSRTPAILTKWALDGRAYDSVGDDGGRAAKVEAWDESTSSWVTVYSGGASGLGLNSFPTTQTDLPFPSLKLKVMLEGWGTGDADYKYTKIRDFRIGGVGVNVFYLQWVEEGLI